MSIIEALRNSLGCRRVSISLGVTEEMYKDVSVEDCYGRGIATYIDIVENDIYDVAKLKFNDYVKYGWRLNRNISVCMPEIAYWFIRGVSADCYSILYRYALLSGLKRAGYELSEVSEMYITGVEESIYGSDKC